MEFRYCTYLLTLALPLAQRLNLEFSERPDEFSERPDEFSERPDEFSERPDEFSERPDEFPERPDEFSERPDEFPERPDEFSERPDEFSESQIFTPHCLKDGAGVGEGQDDTFGDNQVTNLKVVVICQLTQAIASAKASPADERLAPA